MLEYADVISRQDFCPYKRSYLGIIVLDHIFYVLPIHETSRVKLGKREAVLINVEIILHPSHILHQRWFPILETHITLGRTFFVFWRTRIHLKRFYALGVNFFPFYEPENYCLVVMLHCGLQVAGAGPVNVLSQSCLTVLEPREQKEEGAKDV